MFPLPDSRLKHIRIGTTDVDPAVTPPTISSIQVGDVSIKFLVSSFGRQYHL